MTTSSHSPRPSSVSAGARRARFDAPPLTAQRRASRPLPRGPESRQVAPTSISLGRSATARRPLRHQAGRHRRAVLLRRLLRLGLDRKGRNQLRRDSRPDGAWRQQRGTRQRTRHRSDHGGRIDGQGRRRLRCQRRHPPARKRPRRRRNRGAHGAGLVLASRIHDFRAEIIGSCTESRPPTVSGL
jgi:hypothetical protein